VGDEDDEWDTDLALDLATKDLDAALLAAQAAAAAKAAAAAADAAAGEVTKAKGAALNLRPLRYTKNEHGVIGYAVDKEFEWDKEAYLSSAALSAGRRSSALRKVLNRYDAATAEATELKDEDRVEDLLLKRGLWAVKDPEITGIDNRGAGAGAGAGGGEEGGEEPAPARAQRKKKGLDWKALLPRISVEKCPQDAPDYYY